MGKLFGTDGVRGLANKELTPALAFDLGRAGAFILGKEKSSRPVILVGMDTRISGHMLKSSIVAGICSVGAKALVAGVIPTPGIAYLVRKYKADAGIVISASHNPYEFNGIKFFNSEGYKLPDLIEDKIEEMILEKSDSIVSSLGQDIGIEEIITDSQNDYSRHLCDVFNSTLEGFTIALDCANGAAYKTAPETFKRLGAQIFAFETDPDGLNINYRCGSTYIENISRKTVDCGTMLGIAFDGDADRALFCDENGVPVDGDKILAILGKYMKQNNGLNKNTIVSTVMANMGLDEACFKEGISLAKTKVGDRYVLEKMMAEGYNLGGEQSGHIIFSDVSTTGDGLVTALKLLEVLKNTGAKLSELASVMEIYPQVLINARVSNMRKYDYLKDEIIIDAIKEIENRLNNNGRILIRPSGTEPFVRVMIEGKNKEEISVMAQKIVVLIEERMG